MQKLSVEIYGFENEQGEIELPFAEYMEKYVLVKDDSDTEKARKVKQIMNIKAHINYLIENKGSYNLPEKSQLYIDRDVAVFKIKEGRTLIRIAFITIPNKCIVLLNATDKPALYDKAKKSQVDKHIQSFLDDSENYRDDFLKNRLSIPFFQLYGDNVKQ